MEINVTLKIEPIDDEPLTVERVIDMLEDLQHAARSSDSISGLATCDIKTVHGNSLWEAIAEKL